MSFKGLETSKNLLRLTGEYVSSSDSDNSSGNEEQKLGSGTRSKSRKNHLANLAEETKGGEAAALTELPEDYDLVEEIHD